MTPAEPTTENVAPGSEDRLGRIGALVAAVLAPLILYLLQISNSRLLVSWHGFLHSAIANRFPTPVLPPENPFLVGVPLPYYWFHQMVAAGLGAIAGIDLIRAFQIIILVSLAGVIVAGASLGRTAFRSAGLGVLVAYLALAGVDPFGPVIAVAKHVVRDAPLLHGSPPEAVREAIFVSNDLADEWMLQPMMPAQYVGSDWRFGQNIVWFFDISSRAPAIALTLAMLALLVRRRTVLNLVLIGGTSAVLAATNPVMALPIAGTLLAACAVVAWGPVLRAQPFNRDTRALVAGAVAICAGAALAAPSYLHLFTRGQGGWSFSTPSGGGLKWISLTLSFAPIIVLAIAGARRAAPPVRAHMQAVALAGLALLAATYVFDLNTLKNLERGNEHNLANAALCLLAIPAVAWMAEGARPASGWLRRPALAVFLFFLPASVVTVAAYFGSPPLPIAFEARTLVRLPAGGPLDAMYGWIRKSTLRDAVFIVDPAAPVKMSGNVSELPAFTARTLFVDQPGYLTDGHKDAAFRRTLSSAATAGKALTPEQLTYLRNLKRPMYLVTHRADSPDLLQSLEQRYGTPRFRAGFVAVFAIE